MKRAIVAFAAILLVAVSIAGPIQNVTQKDPIRKTMLDLVRGPMERNVGMKLKFVVEKMVRQDYFVFLRFTPISANGNKINWKRTKWREAYDAGAFDPSGAALFKLVGSHWKMLTWAFGGTDVYWEPWPEQFGCSKALLGLQD